MRKFVLLICFIIVAHYSISQNYNFGIGLTFQPYFHKNYNKSDWNNKPRSYPVHPNNFNGKAIGVTFQKPLGEITSLKADVLYSNESQIHALLSAETSHPITKDTVRLYGTEVNTRFNHLRVPIQLCISYEISYQSGLFVSFSIGPQISYLTDYLSSYDSYQFDIVNKNIDYNLLINHIDYSPKLFKQYIWRIHEQEYEHFTGETPYIYSRFLIGSIVELKLQKIILGNFIFGLGGILEYDFTNSENFPYWVSPGLGGISDHNRAPSHNLRYGLQFNFMYMLE